jgi:2-succinyl-6-hydroxy-2,4-cyclohexadiene-1-carboxylate synthase
MSAPNSLSLVSVGGGSRTMVLVHGFTQTGASWLPLVEELRLLIPDMRFLLVDLPGHGASTDISADLRTTADLLVSLGGPAIYVGYSLGARVVLHAALQQPNVLESCVLISGTPGITDDKERAQRRASDELLADRILTIGTRDFIDEWLRQPLFATLSPSQARRDERYANNAKGLADSLRTSGTGTQSPQWDLLKDCYVPMLLVAGSLDTKFRDIASQMGDVLPDARTAIIDHAGHSAHLERPAAVAQAIANFLEDS